MPQEPVVIPEKIYFKIGEVCELVGVQAHVLRYWETEFPMLSPQKNSSGQRSYRRRDVEIALRIKQLLYNEMFTIAGAKKKLQAEQREGKAKQANAASAAKTTPVAEPPAQPKAAPPPRDRFLEPTLFEGVFDIPPDDRPSKPASEPRAQQREEPQASQMQVPRQHTEVLRTVATHLLELRELLRTQRPG
jgi:DNA-binding transcriptional MerR regulator